MIKQCDRCCEKINTDIDMHIVDQIDNENNPVYLCENCMPKLMKNEPEIKGGIPVVYKDRFTYFISYSVQTPKGNIYFANSVIDSDKHFQGLADINNIHAHIDSQLPEGHTGILISFQEMIGPGPEVKS